MYDYDLTLGDYLLLSMPLIIFGLAIVIGFHQDARENRERKLYQQICNESGGVYINNYHRGQCLTKKELEKLRGENNGNNK